MKEVFKEIPGFKDYKISNLGRIKSFKRKKHTYIKQSIDSGGYCSVGLYLNCKLKKTITIHLLMAKTFLNHTSEGGITKYNSLVIDHINNIKTDNRIENLQIITHRENCTKETHGTSKYNGVHWISREKKWGAGIRINKKGYYLGLFNYEEDAHSSYLLALNNFHKGILPERVKRSNCSSKYIGVCKVKRTGKWVSSFNGKHLGTFKTENEAYLKYKEASKIKTGLRIIN